MILDCAEFSIEYEEETNTEEDWWITLGLKIYIGKFIYKNMSLNMNLYDELNFRRHFERYA